MKFPFCLTLIFLVSFSSYSQYSPYPIDSVSEENYSRAEIRQLLLSVDNLEVYQLAKSSRRHNTLAVVFYTLGGLYLAGGVAALVEMGNGNDTYGILPYAAGIGFGAGAIGIALGSWQSVKSRLTLNQALHLYKQNSANTNRVP